MFYSKMRVGNGLTFCTFHGEQGRRFRCCGVKCRRCRGRTRLPDKEGAVMAG